MKVAHQIAKYLVYHWKTCHLKMSVMIAIAQYQGLYTDNPLEVDENFEGRDEGLA